MGIWRWFLLLIPIVVVVDGIEYVCPSQQVMGFVKQDDREIDLSPVSANLCGYIKTCTYIRGPAVCLAKGQYLAAVTEVDGKIQGLCCQYAPVEEHKNDDCHELVITADDQDHTTTRAGAYHTTPAQKKTPFPRPPAGGVNGGRPPPPPSNGKGKEEVVMELKQTGPGNPVQLVKAIKSIKTNGVQGYSVTVCTPQCSRTSTRRPTTQKPRSHERSPEKEKKPEPPPPGGHPKKGLFGGNGHCFSGDMTVKTSTGTKRMDQLRAGDKVLVSSANSKPLFEPVEWLYHRDPTAVADFITVTTRSNYTLQLSTEHLIPLVPCSNDNLSDADLEEHANAHSVFARRLKVGQCIAVLANPHFIADHVTHVTRKRKRGIYSPITSHGTIVVNDIFASCYSSVENHLAQKAVHSTLIIARRWASKIWNALFGVGLAREDADVPMPLQMILKMAKFVMPASTVNG